MWFTARMWRTEDVTMRPISPMLSGVTLEHSKSGVGQLGALP